MNPGWIVGALLLFLIPGAYGILLVTRPVVMSAWIKKFYGRFGAFGEFLASMVNPVVTRTFGVMFILMGVLIVVSTFGPFLLGWREP